MPSPFFDVFAPSLAQGLSQGAAGAIEGRVKGQQLGREFRGLDLENMVRELAIMQAQQKLKQSTIHPLAYGGAVIQDPTGEITYRESQGGQGFLASLFGRDPQAFEAYLGATKRAELLAHPERGALGLERDYRREYLDPARVGLLGEKGRTEQARQDYLGGRTGYTEALTEEVAPTAEATRQKLGAQTTTESAKQGLLKAKTGAAGVTAGKISQGQVIGRLLDKVASGGELSDMEEAALSLYKQLHPPAAQESVTFAPNPLTGTSEMKQTIKGAKATDIQKAMPKAQTLVQNTIQASRGFFGIDKQAARAALEAVLRDTKLTDAEKQAIRFQMDVQLK